MTVCACCGQEIKSGSKTTIQVDDKLLATCNRAFEKASKSESAHVQIAHVVSCIHSPPHTDPHFARIQRLRNAADRLLLTSGHKSTGQPPRVSDDLKELLRRSEVIAKRLGRAYASQSDFVEALVNTSSDLHSAQFAIARTIGQNHYSAPSESNGVTVRPDPEFAIKARASSYRVDCEASDRPASSFTNWQTQSDRRYREQRPLADQESKSRIDQFNNGTSLPAPTQNRTSKVELSQKNISIESLKDILDRLDRQEQLLGRIASLQGQMIEEEQKFAIRSKREASVLRNTVRSETERGDGAIQQEGVEWRLISTFRRVNWQSLRNPHTVSAKLTSALVRYPRQIVPRPSFARVRSAARNQANTFKSNLGNEPAASDEAAEHPQFYNEREKRFYLALEDEIVRAPSIGQRTAERLMSIGVKTVRDLLSIDAVQISDRAGGRFFSPQRVTDWQDQARLVCIIPWLRGTHAQLLVGAGFRKLADIVDADSRSIWIEIDKFSVTRDGQSVLRNSSAPEMHRISQWVRHASIAEPARAI